MRHLVPSLLLLALASNSAMAENYLTRNHPAMVLQIGTQLESPVPAVDYVVTQPNGTRSQATAQPMDGRPGIAVYPNSFSNAGRHPGTYRWTASIRGQVVAQGQFRMGKGAQGEDLVSAPAGR